MWISILVGVAIVVFAVIKLRQTARGKPTEMRQKPYIQDNESHWNNNSEKQAQAEIESLTRGYVPKWMFTYNEKYAYREIKAAADELGLMVFAKVRLFDLVEPRRGAYKYKTLQYKIQAKHVDFVICNQKLVAKTIIELDDGSHDTKSRRERDYFVDEVLRNTGYNVLRYRQVNREIVKLELETLNKVKTQTEEEPRT